MRTRSLLTASLVFPLVGGVVLLTPVAHAQEVAQGSEPRQGGEQGAGQGEGQGGLTAADLGIGDPTIDQSTIVDTRVGAAQGEDQGVEQGAANGTLEASAANTDTGADSTNTSSVVVDEGSTTTLANESTVANDLDGSAVTGQNSASENTGSAAVTTGEASVGVAQLVADNLNAVGSSGEISHTVSAGSPEGDLVISFDPGSDGDFTESFRSTNTVTGSGSENVAEVVHTEERLVEIQNDGVITNTLAATAITGENDATQNTGNARIETGDANVAATLLNFLNANVVDGALWLEVVDIFGDLSGNVVIPEEVVAYLERRQRQLLVEALNSGTGASSTNALDVNVESTEATTLTNTADVVNDVRVDAITGENEATQNTGGSAITTGDVEVVTNAVTLANLNVVDSSLGLIIVNALNRWLGFLLGADGSWTPIDHEYVTVAEVSNEATGPDSTNTASVEVARTEDTEVTNDATVRNTLDLTALTGQNTVNQNTGNASVRTGDARVSATVVNVVNTNVVRGNLFAVVVNVFGNWLGDFLFGGQSSSTLAGGGSGGVVVQAENTETGADSTNTIDIAASRESTVTVENAATIATTLEVNADTGHNEVNRNTGLGSVDTGDALAALHTRNVANVTAVDLASPWADLTAELLNRSTGVDSTNTIDVTVNDEREVTVFNTAAVDTAVGAVANTGFNTANRNTLGGLVRTGVSAIEALIENLLNTVWLGMEGDPARAHVGVQMANERTGEGSTNANTVTPTVSGDAEITNDARVGNDMEVTATTGENAASRNTGGGAVGSGGASVSGGLDNTVNQVTGSALGAGTLTLESSAEIENATVASASTGDNEVSRNTGTLALPLEPPLSLAAAGGAGAAAAGALPPPPSGVGGGPVSGSEGAPSGEGSGEVAERGESVEKPGVQRTAGRARRARTGREARAAGRGAGPAPGGGEARPRVLGVRVAHAAEAATAPVTAPLVVPVAAPPVAPHGVGRSLAGIWPWVALGAAVGVGLAPLRRGRIILQRFLGRG